MIADTFTLTLPSILFVCIMIFFAGFVDSVAGGGGIISIPAYLFVGIPPHLALGSNKFSAAIGTTFSAGRFFLSGTLDVKTALISACTSFIGSSLGTQLALHIPQRNLQLILVIVLPFVAVFLLMKRNYGQDNNAASLSGKKAAVLAMLIGFLIGGYDGLLGPGTGTFAIIAYCTLMKYDLKTASGNAKLLNLASNVASAIGFMQAGSVLYAVAVPASVCSIAGSYLGAGLAIHKGAKFIRPMMTAVILLLLGKMAFDLLSTF